MQPRSQKAAGRKKMMYGVRQERYHKVHTFVKHSGLKLLPIICSPVLVNIYSHIFQCISPVSIIYTIAKRKRLLFTDYREEVIYTVPFPLSLIIFIFKFSIVYVYSPPL